MAEEREDQQQVVEPAVEDGKKKDNLFRKFVLKSLGSLAETLEKLDENSGKEKYDPEKAVAMARNSGQPILGPVSWTLFGLACAGFVGVGFGIGLNSGLKKYGKEEQSMLGQQQKRMNPHRLPKEELEAASRRAPGLAFKALGLATVLTISTATMVCIGGKWYFNIVSVDDLILRLKKNVPEKSDQLQQYIRPPLEGLRDSMQTFFRRFRPAIAPEGQNDELTATLDKERDELREIGFDPSSIGIDDDGKKQS